LLPLLFDWDDANAGHIGRHGVSPDEAEDVLLDIHRMRIGAYGGLGERRSAFIGSTEDGGVLYVVTTLRRRRLRVVTARNATERERRWYHQQREEA
jgi:uncharacterized DUF497 family protein